MPTPVIFGNDEDNVLSDRGYAEPVIIYGFDGADRLISEDNVGNELYGGAGDDVLVAYHAGRYDGGEDYDTLRLPGSAGGETILYGSTFASIEALHVGRSGVDSVVYFDSSAFAAGAISSTAKIRGAAEIVIRLNQNDFAAAFDLTNFDHARGFFRIEGTADANVISGTSGIDHIYGYDGDDRLTGDLGDRLYGGDGDDSLRVFAAGRPVGGVFDGGAGIDHLTLTRTVDQHVLDFTESTVSSIEYLWLENLAMAGGIEARFLASQISQTMISYRTDFSPYSNVVVVEAEDGRADMSSVLFDLWRPIDRFIIEGSDGDDVLIGSDWTDNIIDGGAGADTMTGSYGNDRFIVDNVGDTVIEEFRSGTDTVVASVSYTLGANVENLELAGDAEYGGGNELANLITGTDGDNVIDGGAGADVMIGLDGDDTYIVDDPGDRVQEASDGGRDVVLARTSYELRDLNIEELRAFAVDDRTAIDLTGNDQDNRIVGNAGANVLRGLEGADVISGGAGADRLYGGLGSDILSGGRGADVFVFDTALGPDNVDTLVNFSHGIDQIWLESDVFTAFGNGPLSAAAFATYLVYDPATGNLSYDADGSGTGAAILFAQIAPGRGALLDHTDVIVV